jgi:hypothetical protein
MVARKANTMNRYLDIGSGSLDLTGVLTVFREMRKQSWWRRYCPVIVVCYRDDDGGEHQFLFPRREQVRCDAEYKRIIEALNGHGADNGEVSERK